MGTFLCLFEWPLNLVKVPLFKMKGRKWISSLSHSSWNSLKKEFAFMFQCITRDVYTHLFSLLDRYHVSTSTMDSRFLSVSFWRWFTYQTREGGRERREGLFPNFPSWLKSSECTCPAFNVRVETDTTKLLKVTTQFVYIVLPSCSPLLHLLDNSTGFRTPFLQSREAPAH